MKKYSWLPALAFLAACGEAPVKTVDQNSGFDLSSIDSSYAACDDFFHFSAQGWIDANPIPETEAIWGKFNILGRENEEKVAALFEELLSSENPAAKGEDKQLVGDLYKSGMDSLHVEELKFSPIDELMDRAAGVTDIYGWISLASTLQMSGVSMPFGTYVGPDDKEASMNILHLSQSGLGLPDQSYYTKTDSVSVYLQEQYKQHIADFLGMYGLDNAAGAAEAIYNFEAELAAHQMTRVMMRNAELRYNKMSYSELLALAPEVPFDQYFGAKSIQPEEVVVTSLEYMAYLGTVAQSWDIQTLRWYTQWHILNSYANHLHHESVMKDFNFYGKILSGRPALQPRWRRVQSAMGGLGEQIGHLYVDRYFPAEYKARIEGMVEDLRSAFRDRINASEWMSDSTKVKAIEKLEAFTYKIGYPDQWKDYSDLNIAADDYVGNLMRMSEYRTRENLSKMGQPVDKNEWYMGAHIVNAYYNPSFNEVVFPAGILQPPFFMPEADDAINYGAIGGVIGHEFTHGFDDQGSKYDKDGNLENWWTEEDRTRFDERAQKVVDLYSSYEALPGEHVNGELTLGENIADLGGLTLAYHAYLKHMEGREIPEPIGGFTDRQRVFLGWAQVWQIHYRDEALRNRLATDNHSPGEFRVVGPMSNMPEFWDAFGCENGTGMHLPDTAHVVIW